MRRALIALVLIVPALVLIGWLVSAQLPRWTAPNASWFPPKTPGVCAAVDSLVLYQATRADVGGIGRETADTDAMKIIGDHYQIGATALGGAVFGVEAVLPGEQRRTYYMAMSRLTDNALANVTVMYLDAQTGDVKALITAIDDPARNCEFDVKAALLAAVRTPPLILLVAYVGLVVVGLGTWWLFKRRGNHR